MNQIKTKWHNHELILKKKSFVFQNKGNLHKVVDS